MRNQQVPGDIKSNSKCCEVCHEKTDLKVFVGVIPKEGWARVAAPILLLVRHRLFENIIYSLAVTKEE